MSLLEELQSKRQRKAVELADARGTARKWQESVDHLTSEVADLDVAISALTPPIQHKGGETEVGSRLAAFKERFQGFIKADLPEGYIAWEGGACPAEISDPIGPVPYVELKFSDGDTHGTRLAHTYNWTGKSSDLSIEPHIIGYRIFSSSEADSGPGSEAPAGDARIEQTISTLQASSGEGETDETELAAFLRLEGAVKHNGGPRPIPVGSHMEMLTRGCGVWPVRNIEEFSSHWHWDGEEEHPTNIIAYRPIEAPASSTLSTTEPAAYSPVNNADVPVTKPEADVFSHGIQAQKKEEPRKFGSIFGDITKFGRS